MEKNDENFALSLICVTIISSSWIIVLFKVQSLSIYIIGRGNPGDICNNDPSFTETETISPIPLS